MKLLLSEEEAAAFVEQIFRVFNKEENSELSFKEFMMAMNTTVAGSVEEKLKCTFRVRN